MRIIKNIIVLILILSTLLSVASCNGKKSDDKVDTNDDGELLLQPCGVSSCTVTVKNQLGKAISGVTLLLHIDGEGDYNVCTLPITTDSDGKATFTLDPTFAYSIGLMNCPDVYTAKSGATPKERYAIVGDTLDVVLGVKSDYTPSLYEVGDFMADFTIDDVNGNTYNLYNLLKEKKVVMLNFWFTGCGPCANEFPALNTAYNTYKDKIEVLAVNDYGESVSSVKGYAQSKGLKLDMPLFVSRFGSEVSLARFGSNAYPTTVIIDRYGVVSTVHVASLTSVSIWNAMFEYYTSDSYDGTPYHQ